MKKILISLPTIHCESCIKLIGMTLKNLPGIEAKQFDLEKKELFLEVDNTISGEEIARAIREDARYDAIVLSEEDDNISSSNNQKNQEYGLLHTSQ